MKIGEAWLREWVDPPLELEKVGEMLTSAGLEVEEIHLPSALSQDIVVAALVAVRPHPQADRLRICEVTDGKNSYAVVCGAENARPHLKSAFARIGAHLPDGVHIKAAKLRGVKSEGMLCSEKELRLSDAAQGIMELPETAPVGAPLTEFLGQREKVMELAITPNRGDCFSLRGVAREVSALCKQPLRDPIGISAQDDAPHHDLSLAVDLLSPQDCPCYYGCVIEDFKINKPTPDWMKRRLISAGLRPLDLAVDVTNYVMLELGQPLHAFDMQTIEGGIQVRRGNGKEKLTLLSGDTIVPDREDLVIADHSRPVAMAGLIGGRETAISAKTRNIFLEGAFFTPETLFGKQAKYGLVTDAAHRFERGVDYGNTEYAMKRAVSLLTKYGGGKAGPIVGAIDNKHMPRRANLLVDCERLNKFLGLDKISACPTQDEIASILEALGMRVERKDERELVVTPPSHRFDLDCWQSLAEEVARVCSYDKIPASIPVTGISKQLAVAPFQAEDRARNHLAARGYREVVNYSFISADDIALSPSTAQPLKIENPISQSMSMMRSDLLPGLLNCLFYNYRQRKASNRIFEVGMCFIPSDKNQDLLQEVRLGGAILDAPEGRPIGNKPYDFYAMKADVQGLLSACHSTAIYSFDNEPPACVHPGCFLSLECDGDLVGYAGQLHPSLREGYKLGKAEVYVFELPMRVLQREAIGVYRPFSRHPAAQFELSLVTDKKVSYHQLQNIIRNLADKQLQSIEALDIYSAPKLGKDKKSISIRLTWQSPTETLTDDYTGKQAEKLVKQLADKHNIHLRLE